MARKLRDAVVVITGASSGIGRTTARRFAKRGARLVLTARSEPLLARVAEECRERGAADVVVVPADVSEEKAVAEVANAATDRFGRIDVWVNNASVAAWGRVDEIPTEDWRRVFDVNALGYVHGTRAVLPIFREQGSGVVINVGSLASDVTEPFNAPYTMSKHAVRALAGSLRQELRRDGIKGVDVVTIMPATIDTPFFQHSANYTGWAARAMPPVYTPRRVAGAIVRNARRPRREVPVGTMSRTTLQQNKMAPRLTERVLGRAAARLHLDRSQPAPASSGILYAPSPESDGRHGGWHGTRKTAVRRAATAAAIAGGFMAARRRS